MSHCNAASRWNTIPPVSRIIYAVGASFNCILLDCRSYFCNGEASKSTAHETWSSSKIFAMANAAGNLRQQCADAGIDSSTTGYLIQLILSILQRFLMFDGHVGKHGTTPLGDLSTIVCSYDATQGYSSNSLSSYFHDLGWRQRLHDLVTGSWLGRAAETLGGNYVIWRHYNDDIIIRLLTYDFEL